MAVAKGEPAQRAGSARAPHLAPAQQTGSQCAGCRLPIRDRFIFSVIEQNFHQECVRCVDCLASLKEKCYAFEGKLYCRLDYWRRFGPKCSACLEPIKPTEFVQKLRENLVYHLSCFVCQDCKRHLQAGEQLHLVDERRLLCKRDFITSQASKCAGATSGQQQPQPQQQQRGRQQQQQQHQNQQQQQNQKLQQQAGQAEAASEENQDCCSADNLSSGSNCSELAASRQRAAEQERLQLEELEELEGGACEEELLEEGELSAGEEGELAGYAHFGRPGGPSSRCSQEELLLKSGASAAAASAAAAAEELVDANGKRRGPRTTIKPKQLETLRRAFESAPKPSRHTREQLAAETGLNMRVIQVWFQNRRSKERRMKNSSGSARRNFFRSSSRRLRVGPGGSGAQGGVGGPTAAAGAGAAAAGQQQQQQSLIAGGRPAGKQKQAAGQLSPLEAGEQHALAGQPQQGAALHQHNSPSEFGGSSSGGFTYFSDSSNQGDAFAIGAAGASHQQQQQGSQQPQQAGQQQAQQQYLSNGPQDQANLMALESPTAGGQPQGQQANHLGNGLQQQQQQQAARSQQYAHQSMKNTPPPPPPMYQGGPAPPLPPHLLLGAGPHPPPGPGPPPPQMGHPLAHTHPHPHPHSHQHQHAHLGSGQMLQPSMGGLLGHPQGPSVVQW